MNDKLHFECFKEMTGCGGFGEPVDSCLFNYVPTNINKFEENRLYLCQHVLGEGTIDECTESIVILVLSIDNGFIKYKIVYHDFIFRWHKNDEEFNWNGASKRVSDLKETNIIISDNIETALIPDSLGMINEDCDNFCMEVSCLSGASLKGWWLN